MKNISVREIADATFGKIFNCSKPENIFINGVSIDSRQENDGKLFVALKGEKVDGHDFVNIVLEKGALCGICEKEIDTDKPYILVESTYKALRDFAEYYRTTLMTKIVAITGSVGKTTTKDMVASVISRKYSVLKTEGNFNNEIGLPLTIFNIEEEHEYAVLEMGMSDFGEIDSLSKIAKPNICIITNIGYSHIENLGSREGILKAKCEIFNHMVKGGHIVLNHDDPLLTELSVNNNVCFYGMECKESVHIVKVIEENLDFTRAIFHITAEEKPVEIKIPYPGRHMLSNALAAATVGYLIGLLGEEIKLGIENFKLSKMRMDIFKTEGSITIINDVYNASPSSMEASIDILANSCGRKVCIMGDMLELGSFTKELHENIGKYVADKKIDVIIFVGQNSYYAYRIANERGINTYYFEEQGQMIENLDELIIKEDIILVKASRGMRLEKTVDFLKNARWNDGI